MRLADWKSLWSMFGIWFLNITRKSRNFHAFTQAYLAHAQTNFPAADIIYVRLIDEKYDRADWNKLTAIRRIFASWAQEHFIPTF